MSDFDKEIDDRAKAMRAKREEALHGLEADRTFLENLATVLTTTFASSRISIEYDDESYDDDLLAAGNICVTLTSTSEELGIIDGSDGWYCFEPSNDRDDCFEKVQESTQEEFVKKLREVLVHGLAQIECETDK